MISITDSANQADEAPSEMASISLDHSLLVHVQCHKFEETLEHQH